MDMDMALVKESMRIVLWTTQEVVTETPSTWDAMEVASSCAFQKRVRVEEDGAHYHDAQRRRLDSGVVSSSSSSSELTVRESE